jgi:hypothetical protein
LSRLIRQLCVGLAVTVMVTLQGYGVVNAGHRVEHAMQFPGVSYEEASATAHDHEDHDHDHADAAADAGDGEAAFDTVKKTGGDAPLTHHHHGGGDVHVALITPAHPIEAADRSVTNLGPRPSAVPPGSDPDGPLDPPRQNA